MSWWSVLFPHATVLESVFTATCLVALGLGAWCLRACVIDRRMVRRAIAIRRAEMTAHGDPVPPEFGVGVMLLCHGKVRTELARLVVVVLFTVVGFYTMWRVATPPSGRPPAPWYVTVLVLGLFFGPMVIASLISLLRLVERRRLSRLPRSTFTDPFRHV